LYKFSKSIKTFEITEVKKDASSTEGLMLNGITEIKLAVGEIQNNLIDMKNGISEEITNEVIKTLEGKLSISLNVSNTNINTNENSNYINIQLKIENAKKTINNNESLEPKERQEILEKLKKIEEIINSDEKKGDKWFKLRDIGKWIFDKSVDIGITLLPIILGINN